MVMWGGGEPTGWATVKSYEVQAPPQNWHPRNSSRKWTFKTDSDLLYKITHLCILASPIPGDLSTKQTQGATH